MSSLRRHEGYLLIDNRFGPGVTPSFVQQSGQKGLGVPVVGEGALFESATITCSHCHTVVILNPNRSRPRNYCGKCDHYICDNPICLMECSPLNKVLDVLQEAQFKLLGKG